MTKLVIGFLMMILGVGCIFYDSMSREIFDMDIGLWTFFGISIGFFCYGMIDFRVFWCRPNSVSKKGFRPVRTVSPDRRSNKP